jgi:hypothetical protein
VIWTVKVLENNVNWELKITIPLSIPNSGLPMEAIICTVLVVRKDILEINAKWKARQTCGPAHCFNGAACLETIDTAGNTTYSCDCRTASNAENSLFAGDYCQSESTSFCSEKANDANGWPPRLFCTNGGTHLRRGKVSQVLHDIGPTVHSHQMDPLTLFVKSSPGLRVPRRLSWTNL